MGCKRGGLHFGVGDVFGFGFQAAQAGLVIAGNDSPGYAGGQLFKNQVPFTELSDIGFITYVTLEPPINGGQATSLGATLNAALAQVLSDQVLPAINLLGAFTRQVLAYVTNGSLTFDDGQALVLAAQSVITDLLAELEEV